MPSLARHFAAFCARSEQRNPALMFAVLLVAAAPLLVLMTRAAILLRPEGTVLPLWWPAAAANVALMLCARRGSSTILAAATIVMTTAAATWLSGVPWPVSLSLGVAKAVEAAIVMAGLRTATGGRWPSLISMLDLARFLTATVSGCLVGGVLSGAALATWVNNTAGLPEVTFLAASRTSALSHFTAMLLLLPLMLRTSRRTDAARYEMAVQIVLLVVITGLTFSPSQDLPIALLPLAPLMWAAVRFSMRTTLIQASVTGFAVGVMSMLGWGPYCATSAPGAGASMMIDMVQMFVITVGGMCLCLSAVVEERRQALEGLERLAAHDTLTGVGNRRLLDRMLGDAVARAGRGRSSTLMLLDLDGFKSINDTYGHKSGDSVLITTAQRLHDVVRRDDAVFRLGGDEFVLLLADVAYPSASTECVIERVQNAVAAPHDGVFLPLSVSIGAISVTAHSSHDHLLHEADRMMYEAKTARKKHRAVGIASLPTQRTTQDRAVQPPLLRL